MFNVKDIFFFDNLMMPKVLTFVYWLSLLGIAVSGIGMMFSNNYFFIGFFVGLGIIVFGGIGCRLWFELMMVVFKNNEYLKKIAEK